MLPDDRPAAPAPDAGPRRREVLNAEDYHERKLEEAEETRKARVLPMRRPVKQTSPCPRCGEWDHLACIDPGPDGAPVNVGWIPDAPRPDAAVDQHREGECDCCDEWRGALQAERARAEAASEGGIRYCPVCGLREDCGTCTCVDWRDRAEAAEEKAADWHRLADERSAAIVAAEARAARMEAALLRLREVCETIPAALSVIDAALSPAPPEGDGDLRGLRDSLMHATGYGPERLSVFLRDLRLVHSETFVVEDHGEAWGWPDADWPQFAHAILRWVDANFGAALGKEADGE